MSLTFELLARTSITRAQKWHHGNIFNPGALGYWNIAEWTNAAAGEMGEACNAAKKLRRLDVGMQQADGDSPAPLAAIDSVKKLMKELGDTVIYLDLCAQVIRVRLEDCVIMAFNQISEREGFPERLSLSSEGRAQKRILPDAEVVAIAKACNNDGKGLIDQSAAVNFYRMIQLAENA